MGQSISGGIEKEEINLDYQTYGREGDVDYVMDINGEYHSFYSRAFVMKDMPLKVITSHLITMRWKKAAVAIADLP